MSDHGRGLDGCVVVVTGAGSGIGLASAERFLAAGATVVGADLRPGGVPPGVQPVAVDVRDADSVQRLVSTTLAEHGRIDVMCNNAGTGSTTDVIACEPDEWDRVFAVNVRSVYLGTRAVLPSMLQRGSGCIVNTASIAGLVGLRDRAAYCASKGAVIALTRQVAVQTAGSGVRCNCVCPGTVDSPWVGRLLEDAEDPVERRNALVSRQPMGRLGTPEEIADAIVFLGSPASTFMTGSVLVVDGGLTAA